MAYSHGTNGYQTDYEQFRENHSLVLSRTSNWFWVVSNKPQFVAQENING